MKKAFTLVELLIVVVVLVTLMSITFRLSSIGSDQSKRNTAVSRLQRLENCLSGYYAAYGSYPPVKLHGSRNYKLDVCIHGIQSEDEQELNWNWYDKEKHLVRSGSEENERKDWEKVEAACKAQPVACAYPHQTSWSEYLDEMSKHMSASAGRLAFRGVSAANLSPWQEETDWRRVQVFKFGLMSYLLPRYLLMMRGDEDLFEDQEQWRANNTMPCDPITGRRFDEKSMDDPNPNWKRLCEYATSFDPMKLAHVQNIPSQAICARWMPNLEGICSYHYPDYKFFGIDIRDEIAKQKNGMDKNEIQELHVLGDEGGNCQKSGAGGGGTGSVQYILDGVTVKDGFDEDSGIPGVKKRNEFFYYSPEPYQSYVLWSAGPNGRTFPPWVPRESLSEEARACVGYWTEDDIMIMSH